MQDINHLATMSEIGIDRRMTVGEVFMHFRQMPEMRKLVEQCYLDEDLLMATRRFYDSEEFGAIQELVSRYGIKPRPRTLVLDIGAGNCVMSLAWKWAGYKVLSVEVDGDDIVGLGATRSFIHQIPQDMLLCMAIGEQLPFPDKSVNIVYIRQVLHHAASLKDMCREIYRVLVPNGLLLATREHVISKPSDLGTFLENHPVHSYTGGENALLLQEYLAALGEAGFKHIRVLGRWESVINYYPCSRQEFEGRFRRVLARRLGENVAYILSRNRLLQKAFGRYLSMRDNTPGRLYSFIAKR